MHWIIQQSLFKPLNYQRLIAVLERFDIPYTSISIKPGTLSLTPAVNPSGRVYVCGALKLAKIAEQNNWSPGSFLNDDFHFDIWLDKLKHELLNADAKVMPLAQMSVNYEHPVFIRPAQDNKAFDGQVLDQSQLATFKQNALNQGLGDLAITICGVKKIYREYRCFVVDKQMVTGSLYRLAGKAQVSSDIDPQAQQFVQQIIDTWLPSPSVVIDVALTAAGYKLIEFNAINCSGFYDSDIERYVTAIEQCYG